MAPTDITDGALSPEILQEVKRLHFQTRKLADQGIVGRYRSAFRGIGIEFEEVREYVPGDDVRRIDWKVTARSGRPYVKSYREERELTVMIAVDVSGSQHSGSRAMLRGALAARVGAVLTLIALANNDKVGLITYSDRLESYQPPRKARSAVWYILHEVLRERPTSRAGTDLAGMFNFLNGVLKRRAIIFVISDFIAADYELPLATLAKRHDLTAVTISDPLDRQLPSAGLFRFEDPETGEVRLVDLSDEKFHSAYRREGAGAAAVRDDFFRRHGIGDMTLVTDKPFMPEIRRYFEFRRAHAGSARSISR